LAAGLSAVYSTALRAEEDPRGVFYATLAAAVISMSLGLPLTARDGVRGAATGMVTYLQSAPASCGSGGPGRRSGFAMNQAPFRYNRLRRVATAVRTRIKLDLLNPWVRFGRDVHCAFSVEFFSPHRQIQLGDHVRIGPRAYLMCDLTIGNWVLIARNAAFVGRDDHDFKAIGVPMYAAPAATGITPWLKTTCGSGIPR